MTTFLYTVAQMLIVRLQVFLNIVLDEATESKAGGEKVRIGMCVIRGNSVVMMEALDRIEDGGRGGGGGGHR